MLNFTSFSPFSPFTPLKTYKDQEINALIASIGKKPRLYGLCSRTYLVYNASQKEWGVECLGIIKRIIRYISSFFGRFACYRETHKNTVTAYLNLKESCVYIPEIFLNNEYFKERIKNLFKIASLPTTQQSIPSSPEDDNESIPKRSNTDFFVEDQPHLDSTTQSYGYDSSTNSLSPVKIDADSSSAYRVPDSFQKPAASTLPLQTSPERGVDVTLSSQSSQAASPPYHLPLHPPSRLLLLKHPHQNSQDPPRVPQTRSNSQIPRSKSGNSPLVQSSQKRSSVPQELFQRTAL